MIAAPATGGPLHPRRHYRWSHCESRTPRAISVATLRLEPDVIYVESGLGNGLGHVDGHLTRVSTAVAVVNCVREAITTEEPSVGRIRDCAVRIDRYRTVGSVGCLGDGKCGRVHVGVVVQYVDYRDHVLVGRCQVVYGYWRVIHCIDRQRYRRRVGQVNSIVGFVGKRISSVEIIIRIVGERAIRIECPVCRAMDP